MVKAVRIHQTGGPEVMQLEDVSLEAPGPGMVRVANRAIGLNYIDTYHRSGLYPLPLPTGLGLEAAGEVEAVGEGVDLSVGDRVAYCSAGFGAYSETINLPAERLVPVPGDISFEQAEFQLARWIAAEDRKKLDEFVSANYSSVAEDLDGDRVFMARNQFILDYTRERAPGLVFTDIKDVKKAE